MRILLIGNYAPDRQESMLRYAELLRTELAARGHQVMLLQPPVVLGKAAPTNKWLGYIDKFLLFPLRLKRELRNADVVHICDHSNSIYTKYLDQVPNVVTCHDVLAIRSALGEVPENTVSATGRTLQGLILKGLKAAQYVVCVSTLTHTEMLRVTGRSADSSAIVYNALSYPYTPMPFAEATERAEAAGFDTRTPFFLHVGGASWYKNRLGVVQIFDHLQQMPEAAATHMLLVGSAFEPEVSTYVREHDLTTRVTRLAGISNEDLRALYSLAEALLFPSLQEGFGWPVLEAEACACPVFTTNREPMTEVGGAAAVYFDPAEPAAAAAIIARALPGRAEMRRRGIENARRFSVEQMIDGVLRSYEHVLADSKYTA